MRLISKKIIQKRANLKSELYSVSPPGDSGYVQNASGILIKGGGIVGLE